MSDIQRALARKFGPLPAWAWAIIGGGSLYYYRNKTGSASKIATGSTSSTVPAPNVTDNTGAGQSPIPLAPGESVYDPNTGQLIGNGSNGSTETSGGSGDIASAINGLTGALTAAQTNTGTFPTGGGSDSTPNPKGNKPRSRVASLAHAVGHSARFTGPGKYVGGKLGFDPRRAGIKAVGHSAAYAGAGTYKRTATPKGAPKPRVASPSGKPRSTPAIKPAATRTRTTSKTPDTARPRIVTPAAARPTRRAPVTVPVTRAPTVTQRAPATHPAAPTPKPAPPARKSTPKPAPRRK